MRVFLCVVIFFLARLTQKWHTPIRNALQLKSVERFKTKNIIFIQHSTHTTHWHLTATLWVYCPFSRQFKWCANHQLTPFDTTILHLSILLLLHESTAVSPTNRPLTPKSRQCGYEHRFQHNIFFVIYKKKFAHFFSHSPKKRVSICVRQMSSDFCVFVFVSYLKLKVRFPYIYKISSSPLFSPLWQFDGLLSWENTQK